MIIHFLAINNIAPGLSGGDSIWINLAKRWKNVRVHGCMAALETYLKESTNAWGSLVSRYQVKNPFSLWGIFCNMVVKTIQGVWYAVTHKHLFGDNDIVYSASDFLPDMVTAFTIKRLNPKVKWVAGFYLFCPPPWDKDCPYKRDKFRAFAYWLLQRISYPTIRKYADCVFVTSDIDKDKFPRTVVVRGGV